MEEERLELAEGGEERQRGMGRGEGRREELEGEGGWMYDHHSRCGAHALHKPWGSASPAASLRIAGYVTDISSRLCRFVSGP